MQLTTCLVVRVLGIKEGKATSLFVSVSAATVPSGKLILLVLNIHKNLRLSVTESPRRVGTLSDFIWQRRPWRNVLPPLPTQRP